MILKTNFNEKNVIVSLADANYFPLLDELVDSIKRFKESESVAICILDAGLTEEQIYQPFIGVATTIQPALTESTSLL